MTGWALDAPLLESALPGDVAMQPITAVALIVGSAALIGACRRHRPAAARGLAFSVLLLALLDLGQYFSGVDFGIDTLAFPEAVSHQPVRIAHPGRMAEPTAACFLFFSLALLIPPARGRTASFIFSAFATAILVPAGLVLLGYLFGAAIFQGIFGFTEISMPTAIGLAALAVGLLTLRPEAGWMPLLRGDTVGAGAARRLLPIVLVVPLVVGCLVKAGTLAGLYSSELQLAMMTGLLIVLLTVTTIWAVSRFDRLGAILASEHALRESERRLMQSQAELVHVARVSELGAMGSTLAHELTQPLAAITNYIAAGQRMVDTRTPTSRELKRVLAHANASTERAAEIIRRLRAFVIKGEVDKAPSDVNLIIEDSLVLALAGGVLKGAGVQVRFDPAARWVLADPIQIQQVLNNLLRNAVDVMEGLERRDIVVATQRDGIMVEISVADTGPGVVDGDHEQVFASFYTSKGDGMGLGLSISRTIVEAHGGRIWAETGETGAVFRFTLPAAAAPLEEVAPQPRDQAFSEDDDDETGLDSDRLRAGGNRR